MTAQTIRRPKEIDVTARTNELIDLLVKSGASGNRSRAFVFLDMRTRPHIRDGIIEALFPS